MQRKRSTQGFTTVRDVGSLPFLAVDLRNNINAGYIPGATHRGLRAGMISITGGHGDLNNYSPQTTRDRCSPTSAISQIADSPDEDPQDGPRAGEVWGGCDQDSGFGRGALARATSRERPQYTLRRVEGRGGRRRTRQGARLPRMRMERSRSSGRCEAGIDSIEHASLVDDEGIAMMQSSMARTL